MSVQNPELLGIFLASIAGSAHCIGMCGGLSVAVTRGTWTSQAGYHLGRVLSYSALGAASGSMGNAILDRVPQGPLRGVTIGIFVLSILWVAVQTWRGQMHALPGAGVLRQVSGRTFQVMKGLPSFFPGLATVLLPCGWLYGFVLLAAASGSASRGALTMLAFSLGTVPGFALGSWGFGKLIRTQSVKLRRGVAVGMVIVGVVSLVVRFGGGAEATGHAEHGAASGETSEAGGHSCH